ncbi:unnamed protein product [Owenia fusiformis]|uniref:VWFA domain-containing protein n=1 Tax=Owenia fusiformis TaxID=6347 RepID=A0A8S4NUG9_OWEFU|nr:unnamed protein product [Owenia fusiformis]
MISKTSVAIAFLTLSCLQGTNTELNINIENVTNWADSLGKTLWSKVIDKAIKYQVLKDEYTNRGKVHKRDGRKLRDFMKKQMQDLMDKKIKAVQTLKDAAEKAYQKYDEPENIDQVQYYNAKKLNEPVEKLDVEEDELLTPLLLNSTEYFEQIPINQQNSSIHVPTNVYDRSREILLGADWSKALDPVFESNWNQDKTLTWQYFGSKDGLFRNFPGIKWEKKGVDMFDCRYRGWYIQAAATPKDIVILIDTSGSMTGMRMEIAIKTVNKILETLGDNDYFNIIHFAKEAVYVDTCFNRTLVQANAENKMRMQEKVRNITTKDIASFRVGFEEAFQLLLRNDTGEDMPSAKCNKAIMLITDGMSDTNEAVFEKYNWPEKNVRVFTYLIGRDITDPKNVEWTACANKGNFSRIATLADVQEHVQDYIHVLARPLVYSRYNYSIWTSIYMDVANKQTMTSLSMPVYDLKTTKVEQPRGDLLGVVGTDVPMKEIIELMPYYKLGVNGYVFAITHNGYVMIHPNYKPLDHFGETRPKYTSVDLQDVELQVMYDMEQEHETIGELLVKKLRNEMIDGKKGVMNITVTSHYDDKPFWKRSSRRINQTFYYTKIDHTPFSLGLSLPPGYGHHEIISKSRYMSGFDLQDYISDDIILADWPYCIVDKQKTNVMSEREKLEYFLDKSIPKKCDRDMLDQVKFDLKVTAIVSKAWADMKQGDGALEQMFVATPSGLTRFQKFEENITEPMFLYDNRNTILEDYYKHAIEGGPGIMSITVPYHAGDMFDQNETFVATGVIPVHVANNANVAVLGMQMKYDSLVEFMMSSTSNGEIPCDREELICFLLDSNGFIVAVEPDSDMMSKVGYSVSEYDASLKNSMLEKMIFFYHDLRDKQAMCPIMKNDESSASPGKLFNPIKWIFTSLSWLIQETALFMMEFNIYSWWNSLRHAVQGEDIPDLPEGYKCQEEGDTWTIDLCRRYLDTGNTIVGWKECTNQSQIPVLNPNAFSSGPVKNTINLTQSSCKKFNISDGSFCETSWVAHRVQNTNLMLVVLDATCTCDDTKTEKSEPVPEEVGDDEEVCMTLKMKQAEHRKRPDVCKNKDPQEKDKCSASLSTSSLVTLFILTTLTVLHNLPINR